MQITTQHTAPVPRVALVPRNPWERAWAQLRAAIGEDNFTSWCGSIEFEGASNATAHLSVATKFLKQWFEAHYAKRLIALCDREFGPIERISVRVRAAVPAKLPNQKLRAPLHDPALDRSTFDASGLSLIVNLVAEKYKVSRGDLLSKQQRSAEVLPRYVAMYLAKTQMSYTPTEIGYHFGGRSAASVYTACHKIRFLMESDPSLTQDIENLKKLVVGKI